MSISRKLKTPVRSGSGSRAVPSKNQVVKNRLDKLYKMISTAGDSFIGYPCNQNFDYSSLYRFLGYAINNVGDPFLDSLYKLNTHDIECEVVSYFARLTNAVADKVWGYVTNGGTEGNMYGFYLARELYPDGLVYYSEDTHYSVSKILRLIKARSIMIKSQANGEIDYHDLHETIRIHRDSTPIIIVNVGTTMKGAVDRLDKIKALLLDLALPNYYIHADAALSGMLLPFMDNPPPFGFDAGVDSISISGHKMIGSPFPCGVVLARRTNVERIARSIEYIGTLDTTLSGSRNGLSPLFLWYAFQQQGFAGFKKLVKKCLKMADYTIEQLKTLNVKAWRNENSNTVVFTRPDDALVHKWQLAVDHDIAHIITMPHVAKAQIDRFVADYSYAQNGNKGGKKRS